MPHLRHALLIFLLVACRATSPGESGSSAEPAEAGLRSAPALSVEGHPIEHRVLGNGEKTVLFLASIHGDETAGTPLLLALQDELAAGPPCLDGICAVIVPVVNPDGLSIGTRRNANGVDLNRNFPARNWRAGRGRGQEPGSEPETRFVMELIRRFEPWRIVVIHQPIAIIDYDGPAKELARRMAAVCSLPVRKLGARSGSLGSFAGVDREIPTITVELPRNADRLAGPASWERYGELLLEALRP